MMTREDFFEILVREHGPMLATYLRSLTRDVQIAEELFQETWLVAWRTIDRYDRSRPFGPWVRGIAVKLVLAQRRKAPRQFQVVDEATLQWLESRWRSVHDRPGDTLDEKIAFLRDCLDHLPRRYREPIRVRYLEDIAGEPLALRLGLTVETLKKRLQRGLRRLHECVGRKLATQG